MYEIQICPVRRLYEIAADADLTDCAALCVSSYSINLQRLEGLHDLAAYHFHDTCDSLAEDAFDPETAQAVTGYIQRLPASLDTLFVCCDSGESRSAAMAAAVLRAQGRNDLRIWRNPHYHPNILVYQLLCSAFGIHVPDKEVKQLQHINNDALRQAIEATK